VLIIKKINELNIEKKKWFRYEIDCGGFTAYEPIFKDLENDDYCDIPFVAPYMFNFRIQVSNIKLYDIWNEYHTNKVLSYKREQSRLPLLLYKNAVYKLTKENIKNILQNTYVPKMSMQDKIAIFCRNPMWCRHISMFYP
jgi:hypothetical protein